MSYEIKNKMEGKNSSEAIDLDTSQKVLVSIISLGITGNGVILLIATSKQYWQSSLGIYMFSLALADSAVLILTFMQDIAPSLIADDFFDDSVLVSKCF